MRLRKVSRFLLALVLILGLCVPAAFAAPQTSFVITQPGQMPKAGESFSVTVELTGGVEFSAVQFTLRYNQAELSCDRVSLGAVLSDALSASNPSAPDGAIIAAASLSPMRASGVLATVTFTAKSDVTDLDFALADVVLAEESGGDVSYTVTGAAEEAGPSGGQQPGGQNPDGQRPGEQQPGKEQPGGRDPSGEGPGGGWQDPAESDPGGEMAVLFEDAVGNWAESFIQRAAGQGLIQGYNGLYRPNDSMTRAELVTILWRASGSPTGGAASFTDLTQDWYREAVAWAERTGAVNGVGGGRFDPDGRVSREQLAAILHRMAGSPAGMEAMVYGVYDQQFADSAQVSDWAKQSLYWAVFNEIYCGEAGVSVGQVLAPGADANRAQIAVMMVRYLDKNY